VIWSWDIVEPMAYFIDLGASIVFSYHFFATYRDYSKRNFFNFIKQKELEKLYANENFPAEELNTLEAQIEMVEKMIQSSIVINL
jgi:cell division protein FtsB